MRGAGRWLGLAALSASACISPLATPAPESLDRALEIMGPLIEAECSWRWSCCEFGENNWYFGPGVFDEYGCTEQLRVSVGAGSTHEVLAGHPANRTLEIARALDEGWIRPREGAIAACAESLEARLCNAYAPPNNQGRCVPGVIPSQNDPCQLERLFEGLIEAGAECPAGSDFACAQGDCAPTFAGVGICTRRAAFGERCAQDQDCREGLFCDPVEFECRPGAQVGQTCAFADPGNPVPGSELIACAEGLQCDPTSARCVAYCSEGHGCGNDFDCPVGTSCAMARCRSPGGRADPCDSADDCASLRCDFVSGTCLDLLENGQLCSFHEDCVSGFCASAQSICAEPAAPGEPCPEVSSQACRDGYCRYDEASFEYLCEAYLGEGEDCSDGLIPCRPAELGDTEVLQCNGETCERIPFARGEPCTQDLQCESLLCFEGACSEGAAIGEDCSDLGSALPCRAGAYCDRSVGVPGSCLPYRRPGQYCERDEQCVGQCTIRWAIPMCDLNVPSSLEQTTCDGPEPLPPIDGFG